MLQLRALREFVPKDSDKSKKYDKPLEPDITFNNIEDFIEKYETTISSIPEKERYNLFVTANDVPSGCKKRKGSFLKQSLIMLDIDDIETEDFEKYDAYIQTICETLNIKKKNLFVIKSGNGLHINIYLKKPIENPKYFEENSIYYQIMCARIEAAIKDKGLSGSLDPQVFRENAMFRAPLTINKKKNKPERVVEMLYTPDKLEAINLDLVEISGMPQVKKTDQLTPKQLSYIKIDQSSIETGCEFLKYAKKNQSKINEPQWYAMLSVVSRLDQDLKKVHQYSREHPEYSKDETQKKAEYALKASGPRTCDNIETLWDGCKSCPHYKKITSPIQIKGENFIATEHSGFHMLSAKGALIPQYDDLQKFYAIKEPYINSNGVHYKWDGKCWQETPDIEIELFSEEHFAPRPKNQMVAEFKGKVKRTNYRRPEWFTDSIKRMINLQNGILNIDTMELTPHSKEYGFTECLNFEYDPNADAPRFRQMLKDVTQNDVKMQTLICEFFGYSLSADKPKADKILVMTGSGSNGKSSMLRILKEMAGRGARAIGVKQLMDPFYAQKLDGALFNVIEEVPRFADTDCWEMLKNLATGGDITVSRKHKDPYEITNKAKMIMTCNELPKGANPNHGYFRRLLIAPFNATFSKDKGNLDVNIDTYIIENELPGVLNILLRAYKHLAENDYQFTESAKMNAALEEYKLDMDSVARWCEDNLEIGEPPKTMDMAPDWCKKSGSGMPVLVVSDMHKDYSEECKNNGEKPVAVRQFSARVFEWSKKASDQFEGNAVQPEKRKARVDGRNINVIHGVKYKNAEF